MTETSWPRPIPLPVVLQSPTAAAEPCLSQLSFAPLPHLGEGGRYASTDVVGSCELGYPSALTPAPRQVHIVGGTTSLCVREGDGGREGREGTGGKGGGGGGGGEGGKERNGGEGSRGEEVIQCGC